MPTLLRLFQKYNKRGTNSFHKATMSPTAKPDKDTSRKLEASVLGDYREIPNKMLAN